jgi:23S rRNA (adenine2030-N6)-methyltransferase
LLAYRHQFHAGNFADAFKHALLAQLVLALARKDKPFFYLDTHAGIGKYDLLHEWAQKNAEHKDGVARLWGRDDAPAEMQPYLDALRAENPGGALRWYPGSPAIVRRLLRPHDRMVLTELNPKDCEALAVLYARDRQVTVELADGYLGLNAHLPPKERRGLVFIDSSFDRAREFKRLTDGLILAHRKFATGVYALWYPLMDPASMRSFERGIAATGIRRVLQIEISVFGEDWTLGMRGCGMMVVNPPFGFDAVAQAITGWLQPLLANGATPPWLVRWLVPE